MLKKNADSIVQKLMVERGYFYVCGDVSMAADVGRTIQNIFEENGAMSANEARQLIENMKVNLHTVIAINQLPVHECVIACGLFEVDVEYSCQCIIG